MYKANPDNANGPRKWEVSELERNRRNEAREMNKGKKKRSKKKRSRPGEIAGRGRGTISVYRLSLN